MRRFFLIQFTILVILVTVMPSCSSEDEDTVVPSTILSEEIFTKILVDFALAESSGNINVKNVASDKMDSAYAFNPLTENNVTKSQYDSAITFYSKHPSLYKQIYESVLAELSKMQVKKDSVRVDSVSKK